MTNQFQIFENHESNVRTYCRSFPTIFAKGEGSLLFDANGNRFIDFVSGAGALNYGHNNRLAIEAVVEHLQNNGLIMSLDMYSVTKRDFIEAFYEVVLKPRNYEYKMQFTSPTGTSVVESAIKLARKKTKRHTVVAFTNGFHGMTGNSLNITGSIHHRQGIDNGGVFRLPYDGYLGKNVDTIGYFRKLLEDKSSGLDLPAAVVLETLQGEGGLNFASNKWLQDLRMLTIEYDIPLIIDDIQTGNGRTGYFFSHERAAIEPDMICLSKSIGGIGFPMSLLLYSPKFDLWKAGEDNGTFRGNNLAFLASTVILDNYWTTSSFLQLVNEKAKLITYELSLLCDKFPEVFLEPKGIGFMQGLLCIDSNICEELVKRCFNRNLLVETCGGGQVLKLMPALTIENELLLDGLSIITSVVDELVQQNEALVV